MSVNPNITKKINSDELDLGKIASALFAKWYYFVFAFVFFVAIALFYLYEAVPTFQASSSMIVKEESKADLSRIDLLSGDMLDKQTNKSNVQTLLGSYSVISEVINRLKLINMVYDNSNLIARPLYKNSPLRVEDAVMNKWYYNTQKFNVKLLSDKRFKLTFDYDGSIMPDFHYEKIHSFGDLIKTEYFSFRVLRNDSVPVNVDEVSDYYIVCKDMATRKADLITNLTNSNIDKSSSVITLTYKDNNPQLCIDILNTIMAVVLENELALKRSEANTTLAFIDKQMDEKNKKLEEIEQLLQQYKSDKGISNLDNQSNLIFSSITATDKLKSDNESKIKSLDNLYNYVKANTDLSKLSPSSVGISDPVLESLIIDYQELLTKIQGLETAVTSPTPQLKAWKQQLDTKKQSLLENIQNIKSQTLIVSKQLQQQIDKFQGTLAGMPEKEKGLLDIQRQQQVTQSVYQYLLQKKQETVIAIETAKPDNRIQDAAVVETKPVAPVKPLILAIAILFSFVIPATVIFFQNASRSTVANRDDIDYATTIPVLGIIGKMRGKENNYVSTHPKSIVAECFRSVRTNIQLAETGNDKKVIMITSTVAGEGKSYIALNLAVMFAMQNHKVLLLGFDFRKPRLFKEFGLNNDNGLSTYLHGKASLKQIVQHTNVTGLDLITAGPIPDNPSELLSKNEVAEIFKTLRSQYDYIIVDTPPIGVLSDAYVIMKYADMNLYVIRENYSKRTFIRSLEELNNEGKVWNMQIILNAASLNKKFNANYGHYHGYGGKYRYYADNEVKPGFFKRIFGQEE